MAKQQAKDGAAGAMKRQRGKRREKKHVPRGQAHIQSTFNPCRLTTTRLASSTQGRSGRHNSGAIE